MKHSSAIAPLLSRVQGAHSHSPSAAGQDLPPTSSCCKAAQSPPTTPAEGRGGATHPSPIVQPTLNFLHPWVPIGTQNPKLESGCFEEGATQLSSALWSQHPNVPHNGCPQNQPLLMEESDVTCSGSSAYRVLLEEAALRPPPGRDHGPLFLSPGGSGHARRSEEASRIFRVGESGSNDKGSWYRWPARR